MKEQVLALIREKHHAGEKLNILREYLQAFVLRSLHESEAFHSVSFVGGTALRFLYGLPHFSEDLDFSLESKKSYDPEKWLRKLKRDLEFAQFEAQLSWSDRTAVHNGWIKIRNLLKEAGLANQAEQNISVKIEIDTRPPSGATTTNTLINKYFLIAVRHHDLPSLMAGKIHALSSRSYIKGRDFYDLLWYLTQRPPVEPNLKLLQHSMDQSETVPRKVNDWKKHLLKKMATTDFKQVVKDVKDFLENPQEAELLNKKWLSKVLGR